MQVSNKIDQLIKELTKLRPELSDDFSSNERRFNDLLAASISTGQMSTDKEIKVTPSTKAKLENEIPSWVDPDYAYDPENPRKPNMRELMEAMSGKDVEDLYADSNSGWREISRQATNILFNVVGSNEDTRDWLSIMASEDILKKAREQTGAMYEPEVDIQSNFDTKGNITEQIAIIKDSKGDILTSLSSNISSTEEKLLNFGATKDSIPINLEEKIDPEKFDNNLLNFLKNFDNKPTTIQSALIQSASEAIANKLSQQIPLDELTKL